MIGSGGFGVVFQAILSDGTLAAVKQLKVDSDNLKTIDREIHTMSSLPPHPNCVRYFGSRHSQQHYYIIMEFISGGSIQTLRQQIGKFRESVFQRYAYMTLLGLAHLHTHGIIHRDIKGGNVLLDEKGCAKIVDFGCCKVLNELHSTIGGGGTPLWMAPEVCRGEAADEKADVWAYGCLCLEMTNDSGIPWDFPSGMTLPGVAYAIACAQKSPAVPTHLTAAAQDFIACCLSLDPDTRPTVFQLLEHPFFDQDYPSDEDDEADFMEDMDSTVARQSAVKRMYRNPQADDHKKDLPPTGRPTDSTVNRRLVSANVGFQLNAVDDDDDDADENVASIREDRDSAARSMNQNDSRRNSTNAGFKLKLAVDDSEDEVPQKPIAATPSDDGQEEYKSIVYELLSNMNTQKKSSNGLKSETSFSRSHRSAKDAFDVSKARQELRDSDSDSSSSPSDSDSESSTDISVDDSVPPPTAETKAPAHRVSIEEREPIKRNTVQRLSSTEEGVGHKGKGQSKTQMHTNPTPAAKNPLTPRDKTETKHQDPNDISLKEEELIWVSGAGGSVPKEMMAQKDMDAILGVDPRSPNPKLTSNVIIRKKKPVNGSAKEAEANSKKKLFGKK
ncbi:protein kinase [Angomonas deanei]|uniref:Protein tyrosine kinase/Protein kinase domain containing protein, putative n=1 Tax=Angomonas deanei TaxID=59799 RepID=A0A7G2C6W8_9TRYP|nr:protein kinase [Angomonas deanei]CAD2215476.1 Protein tyrosine kinase/Protein kinase domain containing protein, putative [Angomonas deanei]|eukprot:EPY22648.1 protein kinase [Angomonas deanei]